MRDTTVLFYTNNLLAKPLFHYTLNQCIEQCRLNDCELIIVSQAPLTEKFVVRRLDLKPKFTVEVNPNDGTTTKSPLYDLLIRASYPLQGIDYQAIVVGKMEYEVLSVIKQIRLGLDFASNDNIVLMEHDCLYPYNYIEACRKSLVGKEMTYVFDNRVILNATGFFCGKNAVYMGSMAFKKKVLAEDFDFKIANWKTHKDLIMEPIPLDPPPLPDKTIANAETSRYDGQCVDANLGKDNVVMDIKHRLNTCGYLTPKDHSDLPQEYTNYHPYWGKAEKYIDLFRSCEMMSEWERGLTGY